MGGCAEVCVCVSSQVEETNDDVFYGNDKDSSGCVTLPAFQQNESKITPFQLMCCICDNECEHFMQLGAEKLNST